ncbi:exosortase A [Stakelama saccharophila]|uniref:Exosortase A n=1 Tax=Stakelama saccharophila TaxID=3075605 RepID=A0ABZ0B716_9SPHN|nr:exosortase A [Stakelama sp. W311]WNO52795.1 exosortase A [Stakelama sp. W311]
MSIAWPSSIFLGARDDGQAAWRRHLAALAGVWALVLLLFRRDVGDLAHIYWNSTTFGHCLFIAPVVAWLVWQRRGEVSRLAPVAWWPALAIVAGGGFCWLAGQAAGVALFRHLGLVVMLQGSVVTLLGPQVARGLLFPLGYMLFLIPFGEAFEAPLQSVTVTMVMHLLHAFHVPASVDGVLITIPNGYFEVAEACSGAKFLIAMIAFGTLVANVCFVSWRRRAVFMAAALVVPVIANGLRAFGTIYAAWWTSVEAATGFDHIVYGWIFFALVMAAVLALGWRWFDRDPDAPWFDPDRLPQVRRGRVAVTTGAGLTLGIILLFAMWAGAIADRADALPTRVALPDMPGWHRVAADDGPKWVPNYPGADRFVMARYADGSGATVDLAIAVFGHQEEGRELVGFGLGPVRENDKWVRVADEPALHGGKALRIRAPGPVEREVVLWYRIGDIVTASESDVKLETLKAKLLGGRQRAVAVLVSAQKREGVAPRAAIRRFLAKAPPIAALADRAAGGR